MVQLGARRVGTSLVLLIALGITGACGGQDATDSSASDSSPEATTSGTPDGSDAEPETAPPGSPDCTEIWQDGSQIPRRYQGCVDDAGEYVARDALGCSSGQVMVRHADHFYGVLGGTVHESAQPLDDDHDYRASIRRCRA